MKKYIIILFALISWFAKGQDYLDLCLQCAEAEGYYCGDDPTNWTQYSPNGCVQNSWINDGWEDCVDASDENGATPTLLGSCLPEIEECDTVFVTQVEEVFVEVIEYVTITDTIIEEVWITEYIEIMDTVIIYDDILDTLFVDVIEYVNVYDTISVVEEVEIIITEYIDCDTGMPCETRLDEIVKESRETKGMIFNLMGEQIPFPEGIYIENGEIKYKFD